MSIIEEIEAAANYSVANKAPFPPQLEVHFDAIYIVHTQIWPRIKAALLAAQEMDTVLTMEGHNNFGQLRFREAMNGTVK